jgi:hypothetical protein
MKWDKVKSTIAREVYSNIKNTSISTNVANILLDLVVSDFQLCKENKIAPRKTIQLYADKAYEIIMNWDIRCINRLRDLFPSYFPKSLMKGELIIDFTDNWYVFTA